MAVSMGSSERMQTGQMAEESLSRVDCRPSVLSWQDNRVLRQSGLSQIT